MQGDGGSDTWHALGTRENASRFCVDFELHRDREITTRHSPFGSVQHQVSHFMSGRLLGTCTPLEARNTRNIRWKTFSKECIWRLALCDFVDVFIHRIPEVKSHIEHALDGSATYCCFHPPVKPESLRAPGMARSRAPRRDGRFPV